MKNFTDITNLSDAALEAFLDVKSGAEFVDASKLTVSERYSVATALGWPNDARTRAWCSNVYDHPLNQRRYHGPDVEAMILEEQEDEGRNVD